MAKTERGQIATGVLSFTGDTTWLLSPAARKLGATQWYFGGPGISAVGDNDIENAETGVFVDGHDFGDTQGTGKVELGDSPIYASANKVLQTVTAWSDWRITITVALGAQSPGVKYFFVTDGNGAVSEPKTCWVHRTTAIKLQASTNITAGAVDATTNRLTAPTGTFVAGDRTDDTNPTPTLSLGAGQFTEEEMSFVVAPGAINGQSYVFRLVERLDDGTLIPLDNYAVSPQITLGSAPVQGAVTFLAPLVNRITGAKIASGSVRAQVPDIARVTGTKVAQSSVRVSAPVVARATGTKIGIGSVRTIEPITVLVSGAPFSNIIQGSARFVMGLVMRITGSKITSGSTLFEVPIIVRPTSTKIAQGSSQFQVPIFERTSGTKIGLGSGRFAVPIVERVTGQKTLAQGTVRFIQDNVFAVTGSKIATGSIRAIEPITALIQGSSSTAVQGAVRALLTIIFRATGSKVASSSLRAPVNVITRASGSKLANGSVFFIADNTVRATGRKIAEGSVLFESPLTVRTSGTKIAQGSSRFVIPQIVRAVGSKSVTGSVRVIATNWFAVVRIAGEPVIVHLSILVQEPDRLLLEPDAGIRIFDQVRPTIRIDHDQYRSVEPVKFIEVDAI